MARNDSSAFPIGFVVGFFLGCCGLMVSALFFRGQYFSGAVAGFLAQIGLGVIVRGLSLASANSGETGFTIEWLGEMPPEMLLAGIVGGAVIMVGMIGAVWILMGGGGSKADDSPPRTTGPDEGESWVTYNDRR